MKSSLTKVSPNSLEFFHEMILFWKSYTLASFCNLFLFSAFLSSLQEYKSFRNVCLFSSFQRGCRCGHSGKPAYNAKLFTQKSDLLLLSEPSLGIEVGVEHVQWNDELHIQVLARLLSPPSRRAELRQLQLCAQLSTHDDDG